MNTPGHLSKIACITHGGKKQEEQKKELTGEYEHEIYGCASQDGIQKVRNARKSYRWSPSSDGNDYECNNVYNDTMWGLSGIL